MPSPPSLPSYLDGPPRQSFGKRVSPILTGLSHFSTPFISTFLLIHLSAPAVASLGGSSLSSQVMLLGREYYQGTFSEPWLLFAPLGIHVTAGVTKRLLSPVVIPRRPSLLTFTAYPLLLFLAIHLYTHRLIPADPAPPISALSPSELNFEFVKAGLAGWPIRSWLLYGGLVLCGIGHAFEGYNVLFKKWVRSEGVGKTGQRLLAGVGVAAVLSGLLAVAKEPLFLLQSTTSRIHASFLKSLVYRI